ncbi:hypothetical protein ENSA5_61340 [Enhygromyxa salina]|uniref:PDZ domain-containing protein n=1 Tax=Enhygromyxa salina TaxID=215803 RepID=A0A2S9XD65_9BACT|nr:hypothetical protein [Enhygromyxa salina]PRP90814.1 hypothetical protein ENSA5_61340 [Enhygromyxa salina]
MRARSVPLLMLLVLGCRPSTDANSTPEESRIDEPRDGREASKPTPERTPRPAGAIFRSELIRATQGGSPPYLMAQIGPEPYRPQGRFEGWVITRVWPGDPELCAPGCDLRTGDIILSVNGLKLETPEELSNLLERIDEIESIDLTGIRDGEFFERSHPVLPDPVLPE